MRRRFLLVAALALVASASLVATGSSARPGAGLVVQSGAHNYAGPSCPGAGWNCTTARHVLQLGADNRFECGPGGTGTNSPDNQSCVISQSGPRNEARCTERTRSDGAVQVCSITQVGVENKAEVEQVVESLGGAAETASQTAKVDQSGATRKNELHLSQRVKQDARSLAGEAQDIHQRADVTQNVGGNGDNKADVNQDQDQHARDGTTQSQNGDGLPSGFGDCDLSSSSASAPNACANIEQTAGAGDNHNHLRQTIEQNGETKSVATQQQGSPHGGIDGRVHQVSSTGASRNDADQKKHQKLKGGPGSKQTLYDPTGCCGVGSSNGNSQSRETINQDVTQNASEGANATESIEIVGQSSSPAGGCKISHHAQNDGGNVNNSVSEQPCTPPLLLDTSCSSSGEGGGCTSGPPPPPCNLAAKAVCGPPPTTFARRLR